MHQLVFEMRPQPSLFMMDFGVHKPSSASQDRTVILLELQISHILYNILKQQAHFPSRAQFKKYHVHSSHGPCAS